VILDPRKLFVDERLIGQCVFCGATPNSRDHCPSKVFLEEPFPDNLPVVEACKSCNESFSKDEQYLACLLECVICGSTDSNKIHRPKIKRIVAETPKLAAQLQTGRHEDDVGNIIWQPDVKRIDNVILKLARGHIAYELSLPHIEQPEQMTVIPLILMSDEQKAAFENPIVDDFIRLPEIGSRSFMRAIVGGQKTYQENGWNIVQEGNYRYLVAQSDGDFVQIVIGEYLACRVTW
jgi:hypothetical protein